MQSKLLISLDFELHWGVFDHLSLDATGRSYFDKTRLLIPEVLNAFSAHGIHATWATVGLLFARDREQLSRVLPDVRPSYTNPRLDPYVVIERWVRMRVQILTTSPLPSFSSLRTLRASGSAATPSPIITAWSRDKPRRLFPPTSGPRAGWRKRISALS